MTSHLNSESKNPTPMILGPTARHKLAPNCSRSEPWFVDGLRIGFNKVLELPFSESFYH